MGLDYLHSGMPRRVLFCVFQDIDGLLFLMLNTWQLLHTNLQHYKTNIGKGFCEQENALRLPSQPVLNSYDSFLWEYNSRNSKRHSSAGIQDKQY